MLSSVGFWFCCCAIASLLCWYCLLPLLLLLLDGWWWWLLWLLCLHVLGHSGYIVSNQKRTKHACELFLFIHIVVMKHSPTAFSFSWYLPVLYASRYGVCFLSMSTTVLRWISNTRAVSVYTICLDGVLLLYCIV